MGVILSFPVVYISVGVVIGGVVGYLIGLSRARSQHANQSNDVQYLRQNRWGLRTELDL